MAVQRVEAAVTEASLRDHASREAGCTHSSSSSLLAASRRCEVPPLHQYPAPPHTGRTLESKGEALCVCGIRCIVKRAYGVKYTLVPSAVAPLYLRPNQEDPTKTCPVSDTTRDMFAPLSLCEGTTVEKVEVVVSRSPMLSWRWGAKKTRVPSAAAPWYFMTEPGRKPAVRIVEKVDVVTSSTPTAQRRVGAEA